MVSWLLDGTDEPVFPPLSQALREPNGLLAVGGDLSPERLIAAYRRGIFPWHSPGDPLLWWSPDPRMVLRPEEFRCTRSLSKTLRNADYEVRLDSDFSRVMRACATTPRAGQNGTWIDDDMLAAYARLHELGYAHSVETWRQGELIGGLYGVAIGRAFFGESMFAHARDASKIALAHLCAFVQQREFGIIDCQMETAHLASLGARPIPRQDFITCLTALRDSGSPPSRWPEDGIKDFFRRASIA